MKWHPKRIVFISNTKKAPHSGYEKYMANIDISTIAVNKFLEWKIRANGYKVVSYSDAEMFLDNIMLHKEDLVFSQYFGVSTKMRQTQIQTICENYGIKYVGSDSYARAITTDKVLAKDICREAGIATPDCKTLFTEDFLPNLSSLKFPVIVKPRFEGDSIGITEDSVHHNISDALSHAIALYRDLKVPIMIEEFIDGKEMSVCVIGYKNKIRKIGFLEYLKDSPIFSYADKHYKIKLQKYQDASSYFDEQIREKISRLFTILDKLEFARFDFMYKNGEFKNIEVTVDPLLSQFSAMYFPFKKEKISFKNFVGLLISNSLERYNLLE